ncbi:MAG: hypothetical protein ABIL76_05290 [candidate division WOR-3 bacterium]
MIFLTFLLSKSDILKISDEIVYSIKNGDFKAVMKYGDKRGIIFSINAIIDSFDPKIPPQKLKFILNDTTKLFWGYEISSGKEVYMTFNEFYNRFLKKNYLKGTKLVNRISDKKTKTNISEFFKDVQFVEYTIKNNDYDFNSLIIVFSKGVLSAILFNKWAP